jgi:Holliday junction resolvase RusA-like endonuclease
MKFIIEGEPIPQARHRTYMCKGKNINYDPLTEKKTVVRWKMARHAMGDPYIAYKDYYEVSFSFVFEVPKSCKKEDRGNRLEGTTKHCQAPDCDNLAKFYLDSMNGIFFSDDRKVTKLNCEKKWGEHGLVEIEINGFNNGRKNG